MTAKILAMNISLPGQLIWGSKRVPSAMIKNSTPGPLVVKETSIEGDGFSDRHFHGTPDSVLYILGKTSVIRFMRLLGVEDYTPGYVGENLTVDEFDEELVSVGDSFKIGEVLVQATYPRIPCGKVNYRVQREDGMELMNQSARTGVYFRILKTGKIHLTDKVERISMADVRFPISEVFYWEVVQKNWWSKEAVARALENGFFPPGKLAKIQSRSL